MLEINCPGLDARRNYLADLKLSFATKCLLKQRLEICGSQEFVENHALRWEEFRQTQDRGRHGLFACSVNGFRYSVGAGSWRTWTRRLRTARASHAAVDASSP